MLHKAKGKEVRDKNIIHLLGQPKKKVNIEQQPLKIGYKVQPFHKAEQHEAGHSG